MSCDNLIQLKQIEGMADVLQCCKEYNRTWDWASGKLGTTGLSSGTVDASTLDGSTTPVDVYMEAETTKDINITSLVIQMVCSNPKFFDFGAATALTNGVDLFYTKDSVSTYILTAAKSNSYIMELTDIESYLGGAQGTNPANEFKNWQSSKDSFFIYIDIQKNLGKLILRANTDDRLTFRVNDDLSALSANRLSQLYIIMKGGRSDPIT